MDIKKSLGNFLAEYEQATNTHDFNKVRPLIARDAVYWFSEGAYVGITAIEKAFVRTWNNVEGEVYSIRNVQWLAVTNTSAACVYEFHWKGKMGGIMKRGWGRGTNIIIKKGKRWRVVHEHLSVPR